MSRSKGGRIVISTFNGKDSYLGCRCQSREVFYLFILSSCSFHILLKTLDAFIYSTITLLLALFTADVHDAEACERPVGAQK